jgi:hypothetical protein
MHTLREHFKLTLAFFPFMHFTTDGRKVLLLQCNLVCNVHMPRVATEQRI